MHGQYAEAATVLRGAVEADPKNGDAWLAIANALVSHAEGNISPAALYAFRMAQNADPKSPGPSFFLGLAMARAGRFDETRALWADLVAKAPADAPWRDDIAMRLKRLDELMAMLRQRAEAENAGGQGATLPAPPR
jgi:cytochrome c-type biogenesis protein CcmH